MYTTSPKTIMEEALSKKVLRKVKKLAIFSWTPSRQTLLRLEQTGCPGYSVEWNSLWGQIVRSETNMVGYPPLPRQSIFLKRFTATHLALA